RVGRERLAACVRRRRPAERDLTGAGGGRQARGGGRRGRGDGVGGHCDGRGRGVGRRRAVGHRQRGRIAADVVVGVARVLRGRAAAITEVPAVAVRRRAAGGRTGEARRQRDLAG